MTTPTITRPKTRRPQSGPPLVAPVLAFTALTLAYVAVNSSTPHPDSSGTAVLAYVQAHGTRSSVVSWLLFAAAAPLAITTAVIYRRLRALGVTAPGSAIALVGGILASASLTLSGAFAWTLSRLATGTPPALARVTADLAYLAGGPAYAMWFALLVAGLAVPGLLMGLLPRPLAWAGIAIGFIGQVASLALIDSHLAVLLPVVRFGGLLWLIVTSVLLPASRAAMRRTSTADADAGAARSS